MGVILALQEILNYNDGMRFFSIEDSEITFFLSGKPCQFTYISTGSTLQLSFNSFEAPSFSDRRFFISYRGISFGCFMEKTVSVNFSKHCYLEMLH